MSVWKRSIVACGSVLLVAGCATRDEALDELPPTSAGPAGYITDNSDAAFYFNGPWASSSSASGFYGDNYHVIAAGGGEHSAEWNIETIQEYQVFARWAAHKNRASNATYTIHYLDANNNLTTDSVTVNQRQGGADWTLLGTYRMSSLTGRVTLSNNANGYVVADAVRFVPVSSGVSGMDSDGDGLPDSFEVEYGLDPKDPSDAFEDRDSDGMSNVEEYVVGTDPTQPEEATVLGFENNVQPSDTVRAEGSVTVSWTPPSNRENGEPLQSEDIAYYEIQYTRASAVEPLVVDDGSQFFQTYGSGISSSSSSKGYVGTGYHPLPPGNGEMMAEWAFYELVPGVSYQLEANWTSSSNRSRNARYTVNYVDQSGVVQESSSVVDQRTGGGSWHPLMNFEPTDSSVLVELRNAPDGYVIADAVRVLPTAPADAETVRVESGDNTSYQLEGLEDGEWLFQVRAIDTRGTASRFTDPVTIDVQ